MIGDVIKNDLIPHRNCDDHQEVIVFCFPMRDTASATAPTSSGDYE